MNLFRLVAVVLLVLFPLELLAQTPSLQPVPPGNDVIVVVNQGDKAPFTGQLFDQSSAIRWGNYLQQCRVRLVADVELQKKTDDAQIEYWKKVTEIEQNKYTEVVTDYQNRLSKAENPPFYKTFWFGFIAGTTAAVLLAVGLGALAIGLSSATK